MSMEFRAMETEPPIDKFKLALVGGEQNGKSRLASTARKPILFHDFDNKRESLQGIPGVYTITYTDPQWPKQPTAAQDFLTVIGKLEENLDLHALGLPCPPGTICKTNVVDSIATCGKAAGAYAMYNSPDLRREISFGGHKVFIQRNWDAWSAETKEVENNVLKLLALPTDTIVILHETEEEAADSTPEKKKFTGRIDVYPSRYRLLLKYFPEIWRVRLTQVAVDNKMKYVPRVYPLPNYEFDSGTTMLLDEMEEPDIFKMIQKHVQELNKRSLGAGNAPKALAGGVK